MLTERELDVQLAAVAGVQDADLPDLPEDFLAFVMADEPGFFDLVLTEIPERASVLAARQLVEDAHNDRTTSRPWRRRRVGLRVGAALVAVAAAWAATVLLVPATDAPSGASGPIRLVSVAQIAFPVTLDPEPAGLTPSFSRFGGEPGSDLPVVVNTADYRSADGDGFTLVIYPKDPRGSADLEIAYEDPLQEPERYDVETSGTVPVDVGDAEYAQGTLLEGGSQAFADLLWELPDGQWAHLGGNDSYSTTDSLVDIANSLVQQPRPFGLQFGLAPAGWSVSGVEESRAIDVTNDADPEQRLHVSLIARQGFETVNTVDTAYEGLPLAAPSEHVTVNGQPGLLSLAEGDEGYPDYWILAGQFADLTQPIFLLVAPQTLTRDQVLQIAGQISYHP